jgi:phenylacetic acid degradation operon negative regulatory protein
MVSGSTWLSPNPLEKQVMNMLENYNLKDYAMLFTSSAILSHQPHEIIAKGWNLEQIQQQYSEFIADLRPKFEVLREKAWNNELSDQEAFIERTKLVHAYRKFLFDDPGFPQDLMPDNWNGNEARDLFWHTHQLLASQSVRYFESIFEAAPDRKVEARRLSAINPFTEWNA